MNINKIKHDIDGQLLLDIEQLQIRKGDRIGMIGKNGSGKTTFLQLLSGRVNLQSGTIETRGSCQLLPQMKNRHPYMSGGEITQSYIDKALSESPDILLADEPTANLDTPHIKELEQQFSLWQGAFIVVSHDRAFLDALCNKIWEINDARVTEYDGNYSSYEAQHKLSIRQQEQAYQDYVQKKKQLERALTLKKRKAAQATKNPDGHQARATPYYAKKQKKLYTTAKAMQTRIDKLEKVEKVKEEPELKMSLPGADTLRHRIIIRVKDLDGFGGDKLLWECATFHINAGDKVGLIGDNGTGKTTFIKYLLNGKKEITISPAVSIGYFSQNIDILDQDRTILENVMHTSNHDETLIRTVLARLHFFREDVFKPVGVLSGGEQVKVSFAKIFLSAINTLILDEPTNFLDIQGVTALESLLKDFPGTVLFASHDRRLLERAAARLLIIDQKTFTLFDGPYEDYKVAQPVERPDKSTEDRLIIENRMTEVLGKLSLDPSPELETEFQDLLKEKKRLTD